MAFFDLFREYSSSGTKTADSKDQTREIGEISPMPRHEILVENDLSMLSLLSEEFRKEIRFLFILAHPDDEASHLVYLKMLTDLGFPVQVVWLSYGDGSTNVETKMSESTKVIGSVGGVQTKFLPNKVMDIIHDIFEGTDQGCKMAIEYIMEQVRGDVEKSSVIITNAFEGGHLLHDFTHILVRTIAEAQKKEVLEIPQYSLKTLKSMVASAVKAVMNFQWGSHVFYNVGTFRELEDAHSFIELKTEHGSISLPSTLQLTGKGVTTKAGLVRQYQSQWEKVFSKLLEVVEFNKSEDRESIRKAKPIPKLYQTIMHLEKIIKSWFGLTVHPKKLYEVRGVIEELVSEDLELKMLDNNLP